MKSDSPAKKENTLTMIDAIDSTHQIFISYATPDRERVLPFYNHLNAAGFVTWMDFKSIMPGQNWDFEIKKALDRSQAILIFISHNSVERRSYLQKEMKIALENFTEKLISDIYIIPIMLDDVELPEQLNNIQSVKSSDSDCFQKVVDSIRFQFEKLGIEVKQKQESHHISWSINEITESWEGLPGYSVSFQELIFQSKLYEKIHEINTIIKSDILNELQESRKVKFEQNPEYFNHAQDLFSRENTHDSSFGEPFFKGKILSVSRAIHWYGAGAAHPNHHFQTYVFSLSPLFKINSLEEIFKKENNAFEYLQSEIRKQLLLPRNPEEQLENQY